MSMALCNIRMRVCDLKKSAEVFTKKNNKNIAMKYFIQFQQKTFIAMLASGIR